VRRLPRDRCAQQADHADRPEGAPSESRFRLCRRQRESAGPWTKLGLLTGAPAADAAPRNAQWLDAQQPVAARARAYLDINCGHCHSATGPANTTGLLLEAKVDADRHLGPVQAARGGRRGTGDHLFDIVPGKPDDSILPFRMASHETGVMMPEQGRSTTHVEGLQLIRDWIARGREAAKAERPS
jgi:hypothetical protein